ncbi:hypothetical protein ACFPT7_10750 [Acidicapsa dinghuensis]|uniref:Lipoprotein n=1 Tax=Acidicapsa dinghuensis TaxID=2218256 RepID=A0ABW1EFI7_9BACT|nr:hypothetical protein [Acidicapsa dinghuensis]
MTRSLAAMVSAGLCFAACGCNQKAITQQVKALADATPPVVTQSQAAYDTANSIHNQREDYDAIDAFNNGDSAYYAKVKPLLSESQVEVRLEVLKGLQTYVKELTAISDGLDTKDLDASAKSMGGSLTALGNQQGPIIESGLGLATSTITTTTTTTTVSGGTTTSAVSSSTSPAPPITSTISTGLTKGVQALGEFLTYRVEQKELPAKVTAMDGPMKDLCGKLAAEADYLADAEEKDLDSLIVRQRQFLTSSAVIDPAVKRNEIEKMPQWQRQETAGHEQLMKLKSALEDLYMKHHALAVQLSGGNPGSLKETLSSLAEAGSSLAK